MIMYSVDTIIMAGTNPLRPVKGKDCKALVEYKGRPIIDHVVQAHTWAHGVRHIYVVGPKDDLESALSWYTERGRVTVVQETDIKAGRFNEGKRLIDSAKRGLEKKFKDNDDPYVLFSACDIPKILFADLDLFLYRCHALVQKSDPKPDYIQSVVRLEDELLMFDGLTEQERPAPRFKEGAFRFGNIAYANATRCLEKTHLIDLAYSVRKGRDHPIKTATTMFGWWNTIRLSGVGASLFGRTSIEDVKARIAKKHDLFLDMIEVHPSVAADTDNDEDFDSLK
ncbi:hypothetical protein COV93_00865 [Candidatus Woesearchaeota archaeon CG11_big_fil_rev_8_21_14_0_20_43_8]|nr:MAG: hypothetical protein COV93_00865 [Candidatus Woesearchaeota archaeon CG11_big_fil_rev_8_21_14_0_20_43_8]PIO05225.1 MAG: hypothetical protein COT47_05685 [Candidatus Woesearchaeota archaeon CG08_land_8_20_14_0_20_43_7]